LQENHDELKCENVFGISFRINNDETREEKRSWRTKSRHCWNKMKKKKNDN